MHREKLRVWRPNDAQTRTLSLLAEHRRKLVNERTSVTNRITSLLKDYYPQALRWAGELDTLMACDFLLQWPTLEAVKRARAESLRKFYRRHGSRRSKELIEEKIVTELAAHFERGGIKSSQEPDLENRCIYPT